jgi:predicted amidophosphoribosyltransferase
VGFSAAIDLCARRRCFGCRASGAWLCASCSAGLIAPAPGAPIPLVDDTFIPWRYEGAARDLVLALKLRSQRAAALPLAAGLTASIHARGTRAAAITWVPARPGDVRRRGFDHAEAIARALGRSIGLPVAGMLERTSARPDQTTLSAAERRANLVGAFRARRAPDAVLLVDDLVTTGATASSCARALRAEGSHVIDLAAPCRA